MSEVLFARLRKIISAQFGVDEAEIVPTSHLQKDLNAGPISIADLIVRIEEEFDLKVPQGQVQNFLTVGDILNFVADQTGDI